MMLGVPVIRMTLVWLDDLHLMQSNQTQIGLLEVVVAMGHAVIIEVNIVSIP